MKINLKNKAGFSLVELMLYIAISSVIILVISFFLVTLLQTRAKSQTIVEVEEQGFAAMNTITQILRNAKNIQSPATSTSASLLIIDVADVNKNPTRIEILNNAISLKEGTANTVVLTNPKVTASNLSFLNASGASPRGSVKIIFTLTYLNASNNNEFNWSKNFYGSATLR